MIARANQHHYRRTIVMGTTPLTTTADIQCLLMARLGQSVESISQTTGLSKSKISYRMKLAGIKLSDYRNGKSPIAQRMIQMAAVESRHQLDYLKVEIRKQLAATTKPPP
jgi:hypothetical protein